MKSNTDIALLLIRVGLGITFLVHGFDKFTSMPDTVAYFTGVGLPPFLAYIVATAEVTLAIMVLVGIAVEWAGIFLALDIIAVTMLVNASMGKLGGYEFDLMLFLTSLALSFIGPGAYTLRGVWKKV